MNFVIDKKNYKIANKYSSALFSLGLEKNLVEKFHSDLIQVYEVCQKSLEFKNILISPSFEKSKKKEILKETFEGKLNQFVLNFLYVLIDSKHFDLIETIIYCYEQSMNEKENAVDVNIISAVELKKNDKERIQQKLKAKLNKNLKTNYATNPNLIAGFVLEIGEKVIDLSIKKQLDDIRKKLN